MTQNSNGMALGGLVKDARISAGYPTAKSLADVTGISTRTMGDIESGGRPSDVPRTLWALDDALRRGRGSARRVPEDGGDPALADQPLVSMRAEPTVDMNEAQLAASTLASAFVAKANHDDHLLAVLGSRPRLFGHSGLPGRGSPNIGLLTERDVDETLALPKVEFTRESRTVQTSEDGYRTAVQAHGFTYAEVDRKLENGGNHIVAIDRLRARERGGLDGAEAGRGGDYAVQGGQAAGGGHGDVGGTVQAEEGAAGGLVEAAGRPEMQERHMKSMDLDHEDEVGEVSTK